MPPLKLRDHTVASFSILYIYGLNLFSNDHDAIMLSLVPAMVVLGILFLVSTVSTFAMQTLSAILIVFGSGAVFFKFRYDAIITEDILLSAMINDVALSFEMVSVSFFIWLVFTGLIPALIILRLKPLPTKNYRNFLLALAVFVGAILTGYLQGITYRKAGQIRSAKALEALHSFSPLDLFYGLNRARIAKADFQRKYAHTPPIPPYRNTNEQSALIVFVVGESTRGDRFFLNGYHRPTNPKLSTIPNLMSFPNVRSCDTITNSAIQYLFTDLTCNEDDIYQPSLPFTRIFQALGYTVEIYSLQTLGSFYTYLGYDTLITKHTIVAKHAPAQDHALLPYLKQSIQNFKSGKKLLIVHTLGSHQSYIDRIDQRFYRFKPVCTHADVAKCSYQSLQNTYDNTIVAIDDFLSTLIGYLHNKPALLFYTSDHGESLGEKGVFLHGTPKKIAPKEQFDVPLLIWHSDSYPHIDSLNRLKQHYTTNKNLPLSHDVIYDSILGCSGIIHQTKPMLYNLCAPAHTTPPYRQSTQTF